jgi:signal transduction histidine kinase
LRDVTKEKEINRMKANFLSTVSHELRTPLTSILSTYELLLQGSLGELNDDQQEFITLSKKQGEFLSELIENLIDLTTLEANRMELLTTPLDIETLAREQAHETQEAARAKGLQFDIDIQPELPKILADDHKIIRLFKNLLSNAVKFTEHGSIQLRIRRVQEGIQISIRDSGIGISSEYFDKIFEKFFQVDSTSTREFGGSGAGLAICRAIVLAHHGRIWVESTLNEGTTFHVILPFTPYNQSDEEE